MPSYFSLKSQVSSCFPEKPNPQSHEGVGEESAAPPHPRPENYPGLPPGVSKGLRIFSASRSSSLSIDKVESDL